MMFPRPLPDTGAVRPAKGGHETAKHARSIQAGAGEGALHFRACTRSGSRKNLARF